MVSLKIQALHLGTLTGMSQAAVTYQRGYFDRIDVPIIMFAVTGGDHTVIVDTGTGDEEAAWTRHGLRLSRPEHQDPRAALDAAGIDPDDVGTVINTHLHWDHCANNDLFPQATVLIQAAELAYATTPLDPHRKVYERRPGMQPDWMRSLGNVESVSGDVELAPGLRLVHLPGHTPGSQGLLVEAASGDHLIAGDCISCYQNWEGDAMARRIPASFIDLPAYMASFDKIERLGCAVIPSHDARVVAQRDFV